MSDLLAAISRLFSMNRTNDYAHFVEGALANELTKRAIKSTQRQMMDASITIVDCRKNQRN